MTTTLLPERTLAQVDGYLLDISNILKHGKHTNRQKAFENADKWLDERLEIMKGGEIQV